MIKLFKKINNKFLYFRLFDNLLLTLIWPLKKNELVLLVRLDAIGDFILWLDSAKNYKKIYPEKKIVLLANLVVTEIAKEQPYWDEVIGLDRNLFITSYKYRFIKLLKLRLLNAEIAIQPTYSREFYYGDSVIKISGAKRKIGSVGDCSNISLKEKQISDKWYTELLPAKVEYLMELDRNAEFISHLTKKKILSSLPVFKFKQPFEPNFSIDRDYYILFVSASWQGRKWPISHFAELADRIYEKTGLLGLICGQIFEQQEYEKLIDFSSAKLQNWAGKTTLLELVYLIKYSIFVVSNESCATHISASVNIPSVCILGGGHFGRFVPYSQINRKSVLAENFPVPVYTSMDCFGCNWVCPYISNNKEAVPCINSIGVNNVWVEVEKIINRGWYEQSQILQADS